MMTRILFWTLSVLAVLLFVRLWTGPGSYPDIWTLEGQRDSLNLENDKKTERNSQLKAEVAAITQSDAAVEGSARSEMGLIKQGETFYQVILKSDPVPPNAASTQAPPKPSQYVE